MLLSRNPKKKKRNTLSSAVSLRYLHTQQKRNWVVHRCIDSSFVGRSEQQQGEPLIVTQSSVKLKTHGLKICGRAQVQKPETAMDFHSYLHKSHCFWKAI